MPFLVGETRQTNADERTAGSSPRVVSTIVSLAQRVTTGSQGAALARRSVIRPECSVTGARPASAGSGYPAVKGAALFLSAASTVQTCGMAGPPVHWMQQVQ